MKKMFKSNFQKTLLDLANGICLFDCYLEMGGIHTFEDKIHYLQKALEKDVIAEDGYVKDANKLYQSILGLNKRVRKADVKEDVAGPVIACWDNAHYIIVDKDKKVLYDPMGPRVNKYNNITSYRIVEDK